MAFNKQKALEAAHKARDKGQRDRATKEYLKVVREDPNDVRVWLKIGDLYAQKGAKQEATDTYLRVAKFYGDQGFYLKAVAVYKQILKLDPRLVEVNLKLAELYRQLGLISDAMQHFEMVAAFFHREGKTKEALATLRQLVDLAPDNVATRIKLAELYSKEEMLEEAAVEFQHAAEYLRKNDREDDFVKVAERLLWHKPDRISLARELAGLYLKRSDPRRALQKLQACFKADQRDVETLALLAQAFQALEQKGKTVSVLKELARVLNENGQRAQAEEVHRKILAYVPNDPDSIAFLGERAPQIVVETPDPRPRAERLASIADGAQYGRPGSVRPTGSMPIVDEARLISESYEGADVAGDDDFVSDLALDDEPSFGEGSMGSASAEVHSDEIVKILTETDVYVKYGLHDKAEKHLHRVFEIDDDNVEAHERLRDIRLAQGRTNDAVVELFRLAEITATSDPDRAEGYLRELLEIDASNQQAIDLARRFRLDVTKALHAAPVEIVDEASDAIEFDLQTAGPAAPIDDVLDFDELGFDDGGAAMPSPGRTIGRATTGAPVPQSEPPEMLSPDAFDDLDLGGAAPADASAGYDFELEPSHAGVEAPRDPTQEVSLEQVEEVLHDEPEDLDFDSRGLAEFSFDESPLGAREDSEISQGSLTGGGYSTDAGLEPPTDALPMSSVDHVEEFVQMQEAESEFELPGEPEPAHTGPVEMLDDADIEEIHDIDELGAEYVDESQPAPREPAYAAQHSGPPLGEGYVSEPTQLESVDQFLNPDAALNRSVSGHDAAALAAQPIDDIGGFAADFRDPGEMPPEPTVELSPESMEEIVEAPAGGNLEDDLDEADFFISQGLLDEAADILTTLSERYPENPLVSSKKQELLEARAASVELDEPPVDMTEPTEDRPASEADERPSVMLEKPIDDSDADTHFDLGLAYKEMGLFDEAVKEFQKVLGSSTREVQSHLMIGLCHREQDKLSEAITQFKAGLYVGTINEAEKHGLYYEIAVTYESLSDPQEALYYYEMLTKKDPNYRDVAERAAGIRASMGDSAPRRGTLDDDTDAALHGLAQVGKD